jgi:hypothetical protein
MIRFVVCSRVSHPSGRRLADQITVEQGRKCYYYNRNPIPHPELRHVRYGSRRATSENCLNRLEAVQRASNKLGALQLFGDHGVPIPPHLQVGGYAEVENYRRIFRKNERHAGNDNPLIVEPNEVVDLAHANTFDYCMECINVAREFRVHVFREAAIIYQEKLPRKGVQQHPYIRSSNRGWRLVKCKNPFPNGSLAIPAVQAVAALGLDFGAVDVLMDPTGHFDVVEVNTAPGLNEQKASRYAKAMVEWDREHPD